MDSKSLKCFSIMGHIDTTETEAKENEDVKYDAFIGGYVPRAVKDALRKEARDNKRTLSQQFNLILSERYATTKAK